MDTTSYKRLQDETKILERADGIVIYIPISWVISNESRISYTTIIRLIECCREYHWNKDVLKFYPNLDSICGQLDVRMEHPIRPETEILIKYNVASVLDKKYLLDFMVFDMMEILCCYARMIVYLYDEKSTRSLVISEEIKLRILYKE